MGAYLSYILYGIASAFLLFFLYGMFKQRSRNAALFSIMCLTVAVYVIGYGLELQSENFEQLKMYMKLQYFGAPFMTVFWFLFAYKFANNRNPSFQLIFLMMVVPMVTLFLSVTNEYHHLLYAELTCEKTDTYVRAVFTRGPWYYFYSFYSYAIILYGNFMFFNIWRHSENHRRKQAFLLFFGTFYPVLINMLYLFGITPQGLDLTPFGLLILVICYALALFKYGVLEIREFVKSITFSVIEDGIIVVDKKQRLIEYNEAASELFHWLNLDNIGMDISCFEHGNEILGHCCNTFAIELQLCGSNRIYEFRCTPLKVNGECLGELFIFHDVTEEKQLMEKLNQLASYDGLSQIYNRRKLIEEAEKEAERAARYYGCISVFMIDIDHFKWVNDKYGHMAGDKVIAEVASVLKRSIRGIDIIGRYGGEEFVIVISHADYNASKGIAETLRKEIEAYKIVYNNFEISITISIGVVVLTDVIEGVDILKLIDQADEAMYTAKENGRNQVYVKENQ